MKEKYKNPEIISDLCQEIFIKYGMPMPEKIYQDIWNYVENFNQRLGLRPLTEEEKYEWRRKQNESQI